MAIVSTLEIKFVCDQCGAEEVFGFDPNQSTGSESPLEMAVYHVETYGGWVILAHEGKHQWCSQACYDRSLESSEEEVQA